MSESLEFEPEPAWDLDWLTPARCRLLLVFFLLLGLGSHFLYLHSNRVIDLSGDEAQYWDWSRRLDLSYYSKGPLIAYIIHASCAIFGNTMPAVRYPALLFSAGTSIFAYLLTRQLFRSERLALGATLLFAVVPMFIAGSVLMTIDPPMFFCWAAASYFAGRALFRTKLEFPIVSWVLVGVFVGVGFLAKYAEFLFFLGLFGFAMTQRRRLLGPLIALGVACVFTLPVIIWNHRHNWVSLRHVAKQTGAQAGSFTLKNVGEMISGQVGTVGPTITVLMIAGIVFAIRRRRDPNSSNCHTSLYLIWIGLPFFLLNLLASLRAKVQLNWPAPAYFTLTILTAWFLAQKLQSKQTWKSWRPWFWTSVLIGIVVMPIAHDTTLLYPVLKKLNTKKLKATIATKSGSSTQPATAEKEMDDIDPLARLRGWRVLADFVDDQRQEMPPTTFVMCDDYMQTAEMAFYLPDHPPTYCAGPYFGKRFSQYDMWSDRRLDPTSPLVGRDALYVGKGGGLPDEVENAFEDVEKLPELPIRVRGTLVRTFKVWRCHKFKGMTLPAGLGDY